MRTDTFFKDFLKAFFEEFLRLFHPAQAAQVDFREVTFLDKETFTDVAHGERRELDLVVRVRTRAGAQEMVLVHVELEARARRGFAARMFRYYKALTLRHACGVFPIALVFARTGMGLDRPTCVEATLGQRVAEFRYWRIALPDLPGTEYVERDNPLAPALAALMKPGTPQREEWKYRCLKALARFRLDAARQHLLLDCVETYLPLSRQEEARFKGHLARDREVKNMRKTWSEQLIEQGEKRGEKLGEKRGEKLGELRAKRQTLLDLMRAKFGARPASVTRLVSAITNVRRLDTLIRRVLTARTPEEMGLEK